MRRPLTGNSLFSGWLRCGENPAAFQKDLWPWAIVIAALDGEAAELLRRRRHLSSPLWVSNPYEQMDGGETQQLVAPRHPPIVPLGVLIPPLPPASRSSTSAQGIRTNSALNGGGAPLKNHQITIGKRELEPCILDSNCVLQFCCFFFCLFIYFWNFRSCQMNWIICQCICACSRQIGYFPAMMTTQHLTGSHKKKCNVLCAPLKMLL